MIIKLYIFACIYSVKKSIKDESKKREKEKIATSTKVISSQFTEISPSKEDREIYSMC